MLFPFRMHPYSSFSNSSLSPVLSEVFAGRVNDDKIIRRTLLSYTREGFIYYVVRQKEISGQYSLYLMRICENEDAGDTRIHSLVEIQLNPCDISKAYSQHVSRGQLNQFFGEVLLVTFISGEFEIDSNICVYTQNDIDSSINNTIQNCFDGSSATEYILPWINMLGGPAPCSTGMVSYSNYSVYYRPYKYFYPPSGYILLLSYEHNHKNISYKLV